MLCKYIISLDFYLIPLPAVVQTPEASKAEDVIGGLSNLILKWVGN